MGPAVAFRRCLPRKPLHLGFLKNTKGLVELDVLNTGEDRKVVNDQTFAILTLMALFTAFLTSLSQWQCTSLQIGEDHVNMG
ncbi:hypothetical protein MLD38_035975 [Melastoma candidum]|uniref:Uncharacterized protein n=1 Tax=Melastoma candidum TaxID=119954 RepID=A0ACB9LII1_9MYRT|nr:hypothetical protein MLD38_035975 [Melastoma candidum]